MNGSNVEPDRGPIVAFLLRVSTSPDLKDKLANAIDKADALANGFQDIEDEVEAMLEALRNIAEDLPEGEPGDLERVATQLVKDERILSHIRAATVYDSGSRTWTIEEKRLLANQGGDKAAAFLLK